MLYISYIPQQYRNLIVSAQTTDEIKPPNVITIECKDSDLFLTILDALGNKKKITFDKDIADLKTTDLIISDQQYFGTEQYIQLLEQKVQRYFSKIPQYLYFRYSFLNNIFLSKGIYITPENREEKYIEIIEKDDAVLTKYLEEYLQVLSQLEKYEKIYQIYLNGIEKMQYETDETVLQSFLEEADEFFTSADKEFFSLDTKGYFSTTTGKYEESKIQETQDATSR